MKISRLYHTLRYLKPVQFYGRAWFRLYKPAVDEGQHLTRRAQNSTWVKPASKVVSQVGYNTFCFLNQEHELISADDWNHQEWEKLWLYNLHYFDDLNSEGTELRRTWHIDLMDKWVNENPVGLGNGWEPYPTSLRVVNWIKWSLAGNQLSPKILHSLEVQVRYLRKRLEIHLLGNHLLANAKALVFAGLFFQGDEAEEWLHKGMKILSCELPEQVLPDGGHFELSPMYHAIILDDLFDLINVLRVYGQTLPQAWLSTAEKMLFWLHGMIHPDGEISFFNDAAFGIAPQPDQLSAYAERLKLNSNRNISHKNGLTHFEETGYLRWQAENAVAILDVAKIGPDYLPGHAHADTLSFELSLYGQRVFVNSGTSCYGLSAERLRQRGTAAHNTVEVNGENSSDVWDAFRVAKRAKIVSHTTCENDDSVCVDTVHDGYSYLFRRCLHQRKWVLAEHTLYITDRVSGNATGLFAFYHLHPSAFVISQKKDQLTIGLPSGHSIELLVSGAESLMIEESTWHPNFGVSIPTSVIKLGFSDRSISIKITW